MTAIVSPVPPTPEVLSDKVRQLDRLVGLAMLVTATVVFSYYTAWTLLMVLRRGMHMGCDMLTKFPAFRRSGTPSTKPIPASGLGDSNTSPSHPSGLGSCWELPGRGNDKR